MAESAAEFDAATLKRTIHGWRVEPEHACDYCGAEVPIDEPVQYDIVRPADLPILERVVPLPDGWLPDALRCGACETDELAPATEGYDEALLAVELAAPGGAVTIDMTSMATVDFSSHEDGYPRPPVSPRQLVACGDLGLTRWIRLEQLFDLADGTSDALDLIRQGIAKAPETPPGFG